MIKTWRNHAKAEEVKSVIDYNFNVLSKALNKYTRDISTDEWIDNETIIPYSTHKIENPTVQLFVKDENSFIPALGGAIIDSEHNVILSTDLPFNGRVVIK